MASSTITAYKTNSTTEDFALASQSAAGTSWLVAGRSIAAPWKLEQIRKLTSPSSLANDHVVLRITKTDVNSTTGKPVTGSVSLDVSIPKDSTTITATEMTDLLGMLSSVINDSAALAATTVNRVKVLDGRDL